MKKEWFIKTLALSIIVLFIGVVIAPCISAVDKEKDKNNKLKDSNEIKITNDYEEIITFIIGFAKINWIERRGLFLGEVNLTQGDYSRTLIYLSGFKRSENGIKHYNVSVVDGFVYVYHFIVLNTPSLFLETPPVVWRITLVILNGTV